MDELETKPNPLDPDPNPQGGADIPGVAGNLEEKPAGTVGRLFGNYTTLEDTFTITLPEGEVLTFKALTALGQIRKLTNASIEWAKGIPVYKKKGGPSHQYARFDRKTLKLSDEEWLAMRPRLQELGMLVDDEHVNLLPTSREEAASAYWIHSLSVEPKYTQAEALFIMRAMGWLGSHLIDRIDAHRMAFQNKAAELAIEEEGEE